MNANVKQQSMGINQCVVNQLPGREKASGMEWSKWLLIKGFIVWLFALVLYIPDHAQEVMKIGSYIEVERQYDKFIDLVLPTADILASGRIYLEARGADGGLRKVGTGYSNGGEGATLGGWAKIEDDEQGCIPPGSTIRFIIGQTGESHSHFFTNNGGGGGGGTGILFLPPNANNGAWQHLIIAGAGGGGYDGHSGLGGQSKPDMPSGKASTGSYPGKAAGWKYGTSGAEPGWRPNYGDWADWVKVDGKLKGISVADDGTVWGVGLNNEIYRRKSADSAWENVSGTFKQVSVADDGTVWGVNNDNKIYRLKDDYGTWELVPGLLKQVSVAADGTVWGVNIKDKIYRRKDDDSSWERIPGSLTQISHGSDSNVWGVNSKDEIFRRKVDNSGWERVTGLFRRISVATDGIVWGVNGKGEIYRRKDDDSCWIKMISYSNVVFKAVSAGSSTNIWALDKNDDIYYCNGPSDIGPGPIGGKGSSVGINGGWGYGGGGAGPGGNFNPRAGSGGGSCGGQNPHSRAGGGGYSWMNGEYINKEFQVKRNDGRSGGHVRKHPKNGYAKYEISDSDGPFTPWVNVDGKFKDISVADDGTVWGLDLYYEIYRRNADDGDWEKVPNLWTPNMCIVQLSHGSYSEDMWGVNLNNEIYHRKVYNNYWKKVPGLLKQVSVASDGTVWGVNKKNEIYRRKDDDSAWEKVPGALTQISHGSDSDVWGVNSKDEIFRRKDNNKGWDKIPGLLRQISVATDGTVWGVNGKGELYRRKDDDSDWKNMSNQNDVLYTQVSAGRNTNIWALDINDNIYYYNSSNSLKSAKMATSNPDLINGIIRENEVNNPIDMDPDKTGEFCVKVYPNPARSFLTIEVSNAPAGDILCSLFNAYGDLVAKQNIPLGTTQINVFGFPKGLYTVVITADGVKTVEKLMID